jgi:hypothetical protein
MNSLSSINCDKFNLNLFIALGVIVIFGLFLTAVIKSSDDCNCYRLKYAYFDNQALQEICVKYYNSQKHDPMKEYNSQKCIEDGNFLHTWSQVVGLHDDDETSGMIEIDPLICTHITTVNCYTQNFLSGFLPLMILFIVIISLYCFLAIKRNYNNE